MSKDKGNYYTYALRQYTPKDRLSWIGWKLKQEPDLGLILIDGVADLVNDVNNIEECNYVVQKADGMVRNSQRAYPYYYTF